MKQGKVLVEQVLKDGQQVEGYDESLSPAEIYDVIKKHFPNIYKDSTDPRIMVGDYKGHKFAIRCKNVTYLGNPHPHYKKRIQIAEDLKKFYELARSIDAIPMLMGIYSFHDNIIFVNFKIDTYIEKKAHNSSAHIYVSDLIAATEEGYFQKKDYFDNIITAIRSDIVDVYLEEFINTDISNSNEPVKIIEKDHNEENIKDVSERDIVDLNYNFGDEIVPVAEKQRTGVTETDQKRLSTYATIFKDEIIPKVKEFFGKEKKTWSGIECYQKMIASNYRNKYQPEWVGFFLEYEFEEFIKSNHLTHLIKYAQDKKKGGIDLDLYFPPIESYGDLKAHSEKSRGIQGNDWNTIFDIINKQDEKSHVYYIVCEHSTEKDKDHDFEVTKYWNTAQKKDDLMSYSNKMKNNIKLKKVYILDINYSNHEYLTMFKQGLNSNGKPREPKIMIEQDNLKHFVVEQINF